jgi:hypothetical protein
VKSVREQQSNGRRGPKPREHADERPHEDAQEAEKEVDRLEDDLGTQGNVA